MVKVAGTVRRPTCVFWDGLPAAFIDFDTAHRPPRATRPSPVTSPAGTTAATRRTWRT
ncbi:hypothetical protein [Nonomuraea salmonea]|uniref:hypothetical protein n=1 Tax=Nonomuraea salmonea TaxID=46181 RepID=UPI0031F14882